MMTLPSFLAAATVSSQVPAGLAAAVALAGDCAAATLGFVLAAGGTLAGLEGAGAAVPPQPARMRTLAVSHAANFVIPSLARNPQLRHGCLASFGMTKV